MTDFEDLLKSFYPEEKTDAKRPGGADKQRSGIVEMLKKMAKLRDKHAREAESLGHAGKAARLRQSAHDLRAAATRVYRKEDLR